MYVYSQECRYHVYVCVLLKKWLEFSRGLSLCMAVEPAAAARGRRKVGEGRRRVCAAEAVVMTTDEYTLLIIYYSYLYFLMPDTTGDCLEFLDDLFGIMQP